MHEKLEKSNGGFNYNINNCIFEMNADVNHLPFHFHNLLRNLISTSENLFQTPAFAIPLVVLAINGYATDSLSSVQLLTEFIVVGIKPCVKACLFELDHILERLQLLKDMHNPQVKLDIIQQNESVYGLFAELDGCLLQINKVIQGDCNLLEYCVLLIERIHYGREDLCVYACQKAHENELQLVVSSASIYMQLDWFKSRMKMIFQDFPVSGDCDLMKAHVDPEISGIETVQLQGDAIHRENLVNGCDLLLTLYHSYLAANDQHVLAGMTGWLSLSGEQHIKYTGQYRTLYSRDAFRCMAQRCSERVVCMTQLHSFLTHITDCIQYVCNTSKTDGPPVQFFPKLFELFSVHPDESVSIPTAQSSGWIHTEEGVDKKHDLSILLPHVYTNALLLNQIYKRVAFGNNYSDDGLKSSIKCESRLPLPDCLLLGLSDLCYMLLNAEVECMKDTNSNSNGDPQDIMGFPCSEMDSMDTSLTFSSTPFGDHIASIMEFIPTSILDSLPYMWRALIETCLTKICHFQLEKACVESPGVLYYTPLLWITVNRQDVALNRMAFYTSPLVPISTSGNLGRCYACMDFDLDPDVLRYEYDYVSYKLLENSRMRGAGSVSFMSGTNSDQYGIHAITNESDPNTADSSTFGKGEMDGLAYVEQAAYEWRFTVDERMHEVCRLVRSSKPQYLKLEKSPETADINAFRSKQQIKLLALCRRSLALSIGRGMVTLGSLKPLLAEPLPIPPLPLSGRVPPNNNYVYLDTTAAPPELTVWPEFHNAVAAGLRLSNIDDLHNNTSITRSYIQYINASIEAPLMGSNNYTGEKLNTFAGILLAFGLLKYLSVLTARDILEYLLMGHEPISVGVLIGLSATKVGSCDASFSRTLSLHMPSLLPGGDADSSLSGGLNEVEISPLVQAAALAGFGLLYCESCNRQIVEFLLTEMSKPTITSQLDCREAIGLTASWSLGMVLLGLGQNKNKSGKSVKSTDPTEQTDSTRATQTQQKLYGIMDLNIEDRLQLLLDGGVATNPQYTCSHAQNSGENQSRTSRVMEGKLINTGVTSPGAAIALGLMYLKSNNSGILARLALPKTVFKLDNIRPDLLLYRCLSMCLVMWEGSGRNGRNLSMSNDNGIVPTEEWLTRCIPPVITAAMQMPVEQGASAQNIPSTVNSTSSKLSLESAIPLYLCILGGYCLGIGIVYAGTSHTDVYKLLLKKLKYVQRIRDGKEMTVPCTKELRSTIEMSLTSIALGLSITMAGTGDISVLRVLRELRWRVDDAIYGTHMAISMCIGFLFLHGGQASLRRDNNIAIGCLVMSVLPRFPFRTIDNQYHLQALRHLYVMCVEWRSLRIVDVDTNESVNGVDVVVELKNGDTRVGQSPCLLTERGTIKSIKIADAYTYSLGNTAFGKSQTQACTRGITLYHPVSLKARVDFKATAYGTGVVARHNNSNLQSVSVPSLYAKRVKFEFQNLNLLNISKPMGGNGRWQATDTSAEESNFITIERIEMELLFQLYSNCEELQAIVNYGNKHSVSNNGISNSSSARVPNYLHCYSLLSLVRLHS